MGEALLFGGDFFYEAEQFAFPNSNGGLDMGAVPSGAKIRNTARFNQKKALLASGPQLIFIGDSITHLWDGRSSSTPTDGTLSQYWSLGRNSWDSYFAVHGAINMGISSDRTKDVLYRIEQVY